MSKVWRVGEGQIKQRATSGVIIHPPSTLAETALRDSSRHSAAQQHGRDSIHLISVNFSFSPSPRAGIHLRQIVSVNLSPRSGLTLLFFSLSFFVLVYLSIPLTSRLPLAFSSQPGTVEESDFPPVSFKYSWIHLLTQRMQIRSVFM